MEIRSTGLIQRDNFTIDNSVGRKISERFGDLWESLVKVLSISRVENSFVAFDSDGAVSVEFDFFCGDERYVALSLVGDLAKRNFAQKHHII